MSTYIDGRYATKRAHRVIVEIVTGRTLHADDETIEHWCLNRKCIRPHDDHLRIMTRSANSAANKALLRGEEADESGMSPLFPIGHENYGAVFWHPSEPIPF